MSTFDLHCIKSTCILHVRILFCNKPVEFNIIQARTLREKLEGIGIDGNDLLPDLLDEYLIKMPQYIKLQSCVSGMVRRNTAVPQGTVFAPCLFSVLTVDFRYT